MAEFPHEETNFYLNRFRFTGPGISQPPAANLAMVVVIPCYNEPDLVPSLESLAACAAPRGAVEVITVVNAGENAGAEVRKRNATTLEVGQAWGRANERAGLRFHFLDFQDLPRKHAGVGLARKIGMDEAVRRLEWSENQEGIIACFDADSLVRPNYFQALESHFEAHPKSPACAIHYEHPLEGPLPPSHYQAILNYELHLRYYVHALRFAGHPHAHQTIGSSMAVRSSAYQKQGGMNRRKAGEDFYFLHKLIPLGHFSECNTTMVIPSPRRSDRVPFGTGKAVGDAIDEGALDSYPTYAFETFIDLKQFLEAAPSFFGREEVDLGSFPESVRSFLAKEDFQKRLAEINRQSTRPAIFRNRFFRWFDGFKAMKFAHHSRDHFHPNQDVGEAARALEGATGWLGTSPNAKKRDLLLAQRRFDCSGVAMP